MKSAIVAALLLIAGYLAARRMLPAPGAVADDAQDWLSWPLAEPSPWADNQAGEWVTINMPAGAAGGYVGSDQAAHQRDTMPDQLAGVFAATVNSVGAAVASIPQTLGITAEPPPDLAARNVAAFLDMIAYAEGTAGPNGYRTMFGGGLFDSFADHPRVFHDFRDGAGRQLRTSAAGRYQFLSRTWDALRKRLGLPDFSPPSQDQAAIELIRERGALRDVQAGRIAQAITKVAPIWASLPGAGYAQPERKLPALLASYTAAGGNLEA